MGVLKFFLFSHRISAPDMGDAVDVPQRWRQIAAQEIGASAFSQEEFRFSQMGKTDILFPFGRNRLKRRRQCLGGKSMAGAIPVALAIPKAQAVGAFFHIGLQVNHQQTVAP